jgi:hypothetical protein
MVSDDTTISDDIISNKKAYTPPQLHVLYNKDINTGTTVPMNENSNGIWATHS